MTLDVAIIGGGPAGAAAAISLRQLIPNGAIAIFDAGGSEQDAWRPGETLAPGAASILQSLGCWPAFRSAGFLESCGTRSVWGSPEPYENEFLFSMRGSGWRLDRARFNHLLRTCAGTAGAEIHYEAPLRGSEYADGLWHLQLSTSDCRARFVIDATGRSATFAVQAGAQRLADDKLAGVFVLFESAETGDTLIEAVEAGWWYSTTVPGNTAVVAFMTDTDLIREQQLNTPARWNELLAASTPTRERLQNATAKTAPAIFAANSQRLSQMAGPGWVAAGDAAMTFDPLSSQGILKALRSGKLASFVAADYLLHGKASSAKYEAMARGEYAAYSATKAEYYSLEQRWPASPFWARRRSKS